MIYLKRFNESSESEPLIRELDWQERGDYIGESRSKKRESISIMDLREIYGIMYETFDVFGYTKVNTNSKLDFIEEVDIEVNDISRIIKEGHKDSLDRLYLTQIRMMEEGWISISCRGDGANDTWKFYKFPDEWWVVNIESSIKHPMGFSNTDKCYLCDSYDGLRELLNQKNQEFVPR